MTTTKRDITNREDIMAFVDRFYQQAIDDAQIGYIFTEVAKMDLAKHLPVMYDFWETIIFKTHAYHGNAMRRHIELHQQSPFEPAHFARWIELFDATIDELFAGPHATEAKLRAAAIVRAMQSKLFAHQLSFVA